MNIINSSLVDLPTPSSITYMWNMGSLLGICLMLQIVTGLLISIHYTSDINSAFNSVIHISRDVSSGWNSRFLHINGASLFFVLAYIHIGRGLVFSSPATNPETWTTGIIILFLLIATAFLGYVLPWGQISFWGATVITNIFSAIPYLGKTLVEWIWGGFSVAQPTLTRFFALHFFLPIAIAAIVILHFLALHQTGSSNPVGTNTSLDNITFHPFFSSNDATPLLPLITAILLLCTHIPFNASDPENFAEANPLATPTHIQPEWYFLFAYAVLRSIPSNVGGVVALAASVLVIIIPIAASNKTQSSNMRPTHNALFWVSASTLLILTWIGANPVEAPYEIIGQVASTNYFVIIALYLACFPQIALNANNSIFSSNL